MQEPDGPQIQMFPFPSAAMQIGSPMQGGGVGRGSVRVPFARAGSATIMAAVASPKANCLSMFLISKSCLVTPCDAGVLAWEVNRINFIPSRGSEDGFSELPS